MDGNSSINWSIQNAFWPTQYKEPVTIIIPKPNKDDYSNTKAYQPICLLNTLSKLTTKILVMRMNMEAILHRIVHPAQGYSLQHMLRKQEPGDYILPYWLSTSANFFPQYITIPLYAFYDIKDSAKLYAIS
ncbi:hypothetical protein AMATHDRAFT_7954 [Amanita thiersii Skay4041]|uniref:Reverse transcriptase domain-containing protein n=1 Tax=Amanita thiersii Skay4041 TaxID=703135 RepID=A0A2A9N8V6_9AGAR|nr:hypothetical protein AMATHDRAFT_7954 [Amanita thiersii Skay4041]